MKIYLQLRRVLFISFFFLLYLPISAQFYFGNCDFLSTFLPEDNYPAPWFRLNVEIPYNCEGMVYFAKINVCYYCYLSANEVCYVIKKIEVPNGNPFCENELYQAIQNFLLEHTQTLWTGTLWAESSFDNKGCKANVC